MTTAELAQQLVTLCREGNFVQAVETFYADDVVSVEAMDFAGAGRETQGKPGVMAKNQGWFAGNEIHSCRVTGPWISPEGFAVRFEWDFTRRSTGERVKFDEVGVYRAAHGQVAREEFLYG